MQTLRRTPPKSQYTLVTSTELRERGIARNTSKFERTVIGLLIFLLIFLSPFDSLLLASQGVQTNQAGGMGTGMILSVILVAFSVPRILHMIKELPLAKLVLVLGFCFLPGTLVATLQSNVPLESTVSFLAQWIGYSLVSLAVAGWLTELDYERLAYWAVIPALILVSAGSLIDGYGFIDIPGFNNVGRQFGLESGIGRVGGITGPFLSRTQAAIVLEGLTAFALATAVFGTSRMKRALSAIASFLAIVFMFHTGNRSFFTALFGVLLLLTLFTSNRAEKVARNTIFFLVALGLLLITFSSLFPVQSAFYQERIQEITAQEDINASDEVRIKLLLHVLDSIINKNPFGYGPLRIVYNNSFANAHSIVAALIWSTGVLGIVWLVLITATLAQNLRNVSLTPSRSTGLICFAPVFAQFVGGLTHASLGNTNLWIFMGLFMTVLYDIKRNKQDNSNTIVQ